MFNVIIMTSDGPFGKAPEINVSVSDSILLVVSSVGFVILATTIYSIIITRLKTAQEIDEDEETDYDEKLTNADVSTLNRAQRRARARHIMKQQRRIRKRRWSRERSLCLQRSRRYTLGLLFEQLRWVR